MRGVHISSMVAVLQQYGRNNLEYSPHQGEEDSAILQLRVYLVDISTRVEEHPLGRINPSHRESDI